MGFSFSKFLKAPTKHIKSAVNLAKNPFDKDAHKSYLKDSFTAQFTPGFEPFGSDAQGAPQQQMATGQQPAAQPQYQPQVYQAPQQYQSFADLFNQPQFDQSQVTDVYQRGNMPNNLLDRYNSLMTNLQSQQAAMVPRQPAPTAGSGAQPMTMLAPRTANPYRNFAQMFGAR